MLNKVQGRFKIMRPLHVSFTALAESGTWIFNLHDGSSVYEYVVPREASGSICSRNEYNEMHFFKRRTLGNAVPTCYQV